MKLKQKFLDEFEDLDFYNEAQIEKDLEDDGKEVAVRAKADGLRWIHSQGRSIGM